MTRGALVVLWLLVAACGRPTPYQRVNALWGPYGYTDLSLGAGEHAVTVRANDRTTDASVADMLVLRAAEVTLAQGRTHFVVLHRDTGERSDPFTRMILVPLPGAFVPVPVGQGVRREKTGHLVVHFCDPAEPPPAGAVDAAAAVRTLRAKLAPT